MLGYSAHVYVTWYEGKGFPELKMSVEDNILRYRCRPRHGRYWRFWCRGVSPHWGLYRNILSRFGIAVRRYDPNRDFCYMWTLTSLPYSWHMTLAKVMTQHWVVENKICEILSRSKMAVRNKGLGTDYCYLCTVTLSLEICLWSMPWHILRSLVMNNNCVNY